MPKFRFKPRVIEAVQFNGNNWIEMAVFCGTRKDGDGYEMPVFNPIGAYLLVSFNPSLADAKAELWSEDAQKHKGVKIGDWIVKGETFAEGVKGFHIMDDKTFARICDPVEER